MRQAIADGKTNRFLCSPCCDEKGVHWSLIARLRRPKQKVQVECVKKARQKERK